MTAPVHVHLQHAEPILHAGLAALLRGRDGIRLTEHAASPQEQWAADVLLADYQHGLIVAKRLRHSAHGKRQAVLLVTSFAKQWDLTQALDLGVQGYLLQGCSADDLAKAVHAVHQGISCLSDGLYRHVERQHQALPLTARESDVLDLLAQGLSNKAIARALKLGEGTVKTYMKAVMGKLGAKARTEAVAIAHERGLIWSAPADQRRRGGRTSTAGAACPLWHG